MPQLDFVIGVDVRQTARVLQLQGLFEVPPGIRSERRFQIDLPIDDGPWNIGLVVGPSGSGKTSVAREAFGQHLVQGFDWPADRSIVDGFPAAMGIKEITSLLSSVGFSSPPSWLRPFQVLSVGEQFRATLARAMAESPDLAVIDEFTSTVDRTVAQIGSAAVAKSVRRAGRRLVAVTCHYDVAEWLDPDWVLEMPAGEFTRRSVQGRPPIELEIVRAERSAWERLSPHHYLSGDLNKAAKCFGALYRGQMVAFAAVLAAPGAGGGFWREHRCVCLPDFQGIGIGNAVSEFVAGVMRATGKKYFSTTGNPAMIAHRSRSPNWRMVRAPSLKGGDGRRFVRATNRLTAGFEYVGPALAEEAKMLGL